MNIGLIFAGGSGVRMNTKGLPKQFLEMNGKASFIRSSILKNVKRLMQS